MNNYSNRKKILSVLFITSTLCFNLVAMEGAEAPEVAAEGPGNGGLTLAQWQALQAMLPALLQNRDPKPSGFFGEILKSAKDTSKESIIKILAVSIITPVLIGTLEPSCSFFMRLLKKIFSGIKFPFKDGKKAEAKEINERETALDIKRRGLESDKKLLNDMRGMLNKKDSDYPEQLNEIKDLEERHRKNVKEYFELRKELNKKETEYKVVAVEKYVSPQQAAAALAAAA